VVAVLVVTIQKASSETCNVHGLTFMNWAVRGGWNLAPAAGCSGPSDLRWLVGQMHSGWCWNLLARPPAANLWTLYGRSSGATGAKLILAAAT
jgi:hypothetical protein